MNDNGHAPTIRDELKECLAFIFGKGEPYWENLKCHYAALSLLEDTLPSCNLWPVFKAQLISDWRCHLSNPLAGKGKRYRDHTLHPAKVCLMGEELIEHLDLWDILGNWVVRFTKRRRRLSSRFLEVREVKSLVQTAWRLMALFHDVAYPLQEALRLSDSLGKSLGPVAGTLSPQDSIIKHVDNAGLAEGYLGKRLCARIKRNLCTTAKIHPEMGSLFLLDVLDREQKKPKTKRSPVCEAALLIAAASIAVHHDKNAAGNIEKNPFQFLLLLIDDCQEWGRLFIRPEYCRKIKENRIVYIEECPYMEVVFSENELEFKFFIDHAQIIDGKTGWSEVYFSQGKKELLSKLVSSTKFPKISFSYQDKRGLFKCI